MSNGIRAVGICAVRPRHVVAGGAPSHGSRARTRRTSGTVVVWCGVEWRGRGAEGGPGHGRVGAAPTVGAAGCRWCSAGRRRPRALQACTGSASWYRRVHSTYRFAGTGSSGRASTRVACGVSRLAVESLHSGSGPSGESVGGVRVFPRAGTGLWEGLVPVVHRVAGTGCDAVARRCAPSCFRLATSEGSARNVVDSAFTKKSFN